MRIIILLIAVYSFGGCVTSSTGIPDPASGQQVWIDAIQSGDPDRVWAMLSDHSRAQFTNRQTFDAWFERHGTTLLVHAVGAFDLHVRVQMEHGVELVKQKGVYRVDTSVGLVAPSSVRQTLLQFAMSWRVPNAVSKSLQTRYRRMHDLMAKALASEISKRPKSEISHRLELGDGAEIQFKRIAHRWVIADWRLPREP